MSTATTEALAIETQEADVQWPYRMSYETYERLGELALFRNEDHITLLDGILVQTMTKGPEHSSSIYDGFMLLMRSAPEGWHARQEQPIALRGGPRGDSAPESDIAVVVGSNAAYRRRHPEPHEVALVVEVASSAAAFRVERRGLFRYAHAGIPMVVIVGLHDHTLHIHTEPSGPTDDPQYQRVEVKRAGDFFEVVLGNSAQQPPAILGPIAVASFFPPTA